MRRGDTRTRVARLVALGLALALLAAACGNGGGERQRPRPTEPQYGGRLVYGLEADTIGGFAPQTCRCAVSGNQIMKAIYDTLVVFDREGKLHPNLLSSFKHNADYTQWVLTVRDGISFHDGTPLTGAAVAENLQRFRESPLTTLVMSDVADVSAEGNRVTVKMKRPWVAFPAFLTTQIGYVASPKWLRATDKDILLLNEPVGTGPFKFRSYTPGNGNSFVAVRNENYWRKGLPYLNVVEFRVLEDQQSRSNALLSGEIDAMHTSNADEIAKFRKRTDRFQLIEITENQETNYILFNVLPEVTIGDKTRPNPLSDRQVRRAVAMATDVKTLIEARGAGIVQRANGPFPPGSVGYLEDTGLPEFNLAEAKRLVAAYEAENGPIVINYVTTADPFNRVTAELIQEMWQKAGIDVEIRTIDQGGLVRLALTGELQAAGFRNHGRIDPDLERIWWHSETAVDPPGFGINFGRIRDPVIDENLDIIRESPDPEARRRAAEAINRRFGEEVYNLWTSWTLWAVITNPKVHDLVPGLTTLDGKKVGTGHAIGGSHFVTEAWVER